jgi:hypothetical protein
MELHKIAKRVGTTPSYSAMWVTYVIDREAEYCIDHKTHSKLKE